MTGIIKGSVMSADPGRPKRPGSTHNGKDGAMIPTFRHEPGDIVPVSGFYILVGHYGEATSLAVWCEQGDSLPLIATTSELGPFWFVRQHETNEATRVA